MTKRLTKFLFYFTILITIFFLYKIYSEKKISPKESNTKDNELNLSSENNIIKNLKYDVNFENGTTYSILAELSELTYENEEEVVKMQKVIAVFINNDGIPLIIKSSNAIFNNTNYNTIFSNNVSIDYIKNLIKSEKLFLDFKNNVVTINDNIVYEGINGVGKADNIKIDLITKNVQIFMNEKNKKIEITLK